MHLLWFLVALALTPLASAQDAPAPFRNAGKYASLPRYATEDGRLTFLVPTYGKWTVIQEPQVDPHTRVVVVLRDDGENIQFHVTDAFLTTPEGSAAMPVRDGAELIESGFGTSHCGPYHWDVQRVVRPLGTFDLMHRTQSLHGVTILMVATYHADTTSKLTALQLMDEAHCYPPGGAPAELREFPSYGSLIAHGTPADFAARYASTGAFDADTGRLLVESGWYAELEFALDHGLPLDPELLVSAAGSHGDPVAALDCVRRLLDRGLPVDAAIHGNGGGRTALNLAVGMNKLDLARLLLERGADPMLKDDFGGSAWKFAKDRKDPAMIALLEQYR